MCVDVWVCCRICPDKGKASWASAPLHVPGRQGAGSWGMAYLSKAGVRRYSLVTDRMALIRLSVDRGGRQLLEVT